MPFDLSTAQPMDQPPRGGFDLSTAQPIDGAPGGAASKPGTPAAPSKPTTVQDVFGAALEPLMAFGSGAIAKPVSDVAGLGRLGLEGLRRAGVPGIEERDPLADKEAVQRALTYEPRTGPGKAVTGALSLPGELIHKGASAVGGVLGKTPWMSPAVSGPLASGVTEAIEQVPALLGAKGGTMAAREIPVRKEMLDVLKGENAPRDAFRKQAQAAGLVTPPEGTSWLAGIPGMQKIDRYLSSKNAPEFDRLIANNFGLKPGVALSDDVLENIRAREGNVYGEVVQAATGKPYKVTPPAQQVPTGLVDSRGQPITRTVQPKDITVTPGLELGPSFKQPLMQTMQEVEAKIASSPETFKSLRPSVRLLREWTNKVEENPRAAMDAIKQLRSDASANFKSTDPGQRGLGFTRMEIADRLEQAFEEQLDKSGNTGLMQRFRKARQTIAQTYDVEKVIDASGHVNAQKLNAIAQRRPLSGNLELVARFADEFPGAAKKSVGKQGVSPYDWMFVVGSAAARHPLAAVTELAGRVGIPFLAERGMLSKRAPSYDVPAWLRGAPVGAPIAGAALSYPPEQ